MRVGSSIRWDSGGCVNFKQNTFPEHFRVFDRSALAGSAGQKRIAWKPEIPELLWRFRRVAFRGNDGDWSRYAPRFGRWDAGRYGSNQRH
ncbi:hypothetical protein TNIN_243251 [Trichonephila inaurata madagascariensis]|uniref:Uncharacterized protein n=1 Tax=Trichonephila inaurata madagascariensis TaxID=2747483 RepID=A0A8X6WQM4_9ARAC|nr:hypothetical protein TNIN_243251 [Trichonephila inaurata madagascariensis]